MQADLEIFQLPTAQLEDALKGFPSLKEPLAAHADQPSVRPTVPRYGSLSSYHYMLLV
jgi:hypothetical protein